MSRSQQGFAIIGRQIDYLLKCRLFLNTKHLTDGSYLLSEDVCMNLNVSDE